MANSERLTYTQTYAQFPPTPTGLWRTQFLTAHLTSVDPPSFNAFITQFVTAKSSVIKKWRTANGKWRTANGEWQMANGKQPKANS